MNTVPFPDTLAAFKADPSSLLWKNPGIWPVNKPSGPSSNLWVVRARRALGEKHIGHAGTLDPLASGLLVLLAGNATRLFDHMQDFTKTYIAGFRLGLKTDSQDITGTPVKGFAPAAPPPLPRASVEAALAPFRGEILQLPPMHSALKKDGQPLYKLARKGVEVERVPRAMTVSRLELLDFDGVDGVLSMDVSKGFYVRTLIDSLGDALSAGATMTTLVRTAIGPFTLSEARDVLGKHGEWKEKIA